MISLTDKLAAIQPYTQFRVQGDKATFIAANHSDVVSNVITVRSLAPKSGNGYDGNRRSEVTLVQTTTVTTTLGEVSSRNRRIAVEFSLPIGTTDTQLADDAHLMASLLTQDALVRAIALTGQIEH